MLNYVLCCSYYGSSSMHMIFDKVLEWDRQYELRQQRITEIEAQRVKAIREKVKDDIQRQNQMEFLQKSQLYISVNSRQIISGFSLWKLLQPLYLESWLIQGIIFNNIAMIEFSLKDSSTHILNAESHNNCYTDKSEICSCATNHFRIHRVS